MKEQLLTVTEAAERLALTSVVSRVFESADELFGSGSRISRP